MFERIPLRVKLVAAVLGLVATALLAMGIATVTALHGYLLDRVDAQLKTVAGQINYQVDHGVQRLIFAPPSGAPPSFTVPNPFVVELRGADGAILGVYPVDLKTDQGPKITTADMARTDYFVTDGYGSRWRVVVVDGPNQGERVVIASALSDLDNAVLRLIWLDLFVGMAILVLVALVGVAVVRRSLRPLVEIERTAGAIAGGDLSQRVPERDPRTEIGRLGRALNGMLAQIETAFAARATSEHRALRSEERMRRFVADASHELRTPLTTIRGFAELYRQGAGEPGQVVKRIEDEAARMGLLVEDLLLLARLDQQRPLAMEPVHLDVLAADAAEGARAQAPDREVTLEVAPAVVTGDESRLRQVIGNLVTNALTHTPAGTPIAVRLVTSGDSAVIEIADQGPGLTPEQGERVFERFYRADPARSRRSGSTGTGLGLAIVAALVAAHNGTVEVASAAGEGATFRVRLPLAVNADKADVERSQETFS
ncbi:two-component sensor histidine kinase [Longispora fulva]|uniref:histidine kinase n=1 Tax=Longispora fulva TaxID=619741 RepID=A0A8J7GMC3_9ACTN|nr:sensor histidine kinase [Longispora fulva]MBG6140951.1 two-component system OmpR family sensor kinase [Longispora fulva]GIG60783.1 two-component sensor histidine kinase [Longispora fulva]